jgi:hypothetical protein
VIAVGIAAAFFFLQERCSRSDAHYHVNYCDWLSGRRSVYS